MALRAALVAALFVSLCQAQTYRPGQVQIPIAGPLRSTSPSQVEGRKMVSVLDLDGAFVKSITIGGLVTLQLTNTRKRWYSCPAAAAVGEPRTAF